MRPRHFLFQTYDDHVPEPGTVVYMPRYETIEETDEIECVWSEEATTEAA